MNDRTDPELLRDYAERRSDAAFAELVRRHIDLVHSAALRMVNDTHLAEDVTQAVFLALAKNASSLLDRPMLSGWLHRTAQNLAANVVRTDVRRRAREQEAAAMNELLATSPEAGWEQVAPLLDDALGELADPDRDAILLRYFERKSAREIAEVMGVSDEAAQKRVSRAVDRLREHFSQRGVTIGAGGLVAILSANAVQAAPAGLAATVLAASLAETAVAATVVSTSIKTIAMTTLQKIAVTTVLTAAVGVILYESRQISHLHQENELLQREQTSLGAQVQQLERERDTATRSLADARQDLAEMKKVPSDLLRLRGQVGVLREEKAAMGSKSALNKITADPETRKLMREQQKMGMSAIYNELAKRLKLTDETKEQFNNLLADQVMDSIDLITQTLHDKNSRAEIDQMFSAQDAAMKD
ncbi:MAG: sigma-70 family RNA polymerase sigma factor, partial [Tepidisphaeraceae bacterium]